MHLALYLKRVPWYISFTMAKWPGKILSTLLWICIVIIIASDSREPAKNKPFNITPMNNVGDFNPINRVDNYSDHIFYVDGVNGNNKNPGTSQKLAWKTIQKAANTMTAGDTVFVQAGNYGSERVQVTRSGSSGAMITYQANGTVIMKGFNVQANYISIQGFEIANTDYRRSEGTISAGVYIHGSNNIIEGNYIHDASLGGIVIYGAPSRPTSASNNTIKNNRLYHNEMVGIEVNGRNNLIEGNEVWGTVQCHPALMAVEDNASDNPRHLSCPNYPGVSGLDADGMRFFGQGHIFRNNAIHDISYGPLGLNRTIEDYNDNPHIDCFQTWVSTYNEVGSNIIFEQNYCSNLQSQARDENGQGFMLSGGTNNLTIRNNIILAELGINTAGTGYAHHLYIYNNVWINNLSFERFWPEGVGLYNSPYSVVKNNIFYDQPFYTISVIGDATGDSIDYNWAFNSDNSAPDCMRAGNYECVNPPPAHDMWSIDPRFTNPGAGDYHLRSDSPACTAGENGTYVGAYPCQFTLTAPGTPTPP